MAIDGQHQLAAIEQDVKILESIAKKLRADRFKNGALSLDDMKIKFTLDDDGLPTDCVQYEKTESNNLIEEVCATELIKYLLLLTSVLVYVAGQYCSCPTNRRTPS